VTVNLKKISGRSSDVSQLKQHVQDQAARHSLCASAEIIKKLQAHLHGKEDASTAASTNDPVHSSCGSLVAKESGELATGSKKQKYFCRNCGFTMIPAEVLQRRKKIINLIIFFNY
jgi:hypothetical protein